jgi:hypothetical protein
VAVWPFLRSSCPRPSTCKALAIQACFSNPNIKMIIFILNNQHFWSRFVWILVSPYRFYSFYSFWVFQTKYFRWQVLEWITLWILTLLCLNMIVLHTSTWNSSVLMRWVNLLFCEKFLLFDLLIFSSTDWNQFSSVCHLLLKTILLHVLLWDFFIDSFSGFSYVIFQPAIILFLSSR